MSLDTHDKQSLLAHLRHELRTPMNAIIGYSEMLLEELEDDNSNQGITELENIHFNGKKIITIINNLLSSEREIFLDFNQLFQSIPLEIKPSLDIVISNCQKLLDNSFSDDFQPDLLKINRAAQQLQNMIDNLDDITLPKSATIKTDSPLPELVTEIDRTIKNQVHILIVDDNETNQDLLIRLLEREGYSVNTAINGREALEKVQVFPYDLILLDLIMPEMDGYQTLQYLKADEQWRNIPVIMISALNEIDNVINCIEIGAEDYLPKPFNSVLLRARIGACLEKKFLRDKEVEYLNQLEAYSQALNQELEKGRDMQRNFLPATFPQVSGWEIGAFFKPARQVAGDFYDTFKLPQNYLGLVIADVCDKGVGAALFMALFRSLIRLFSGQITLEGLSLPGAKTDLFEALDALDAVKLTNDYIAQNHGDLGMFATLFFGVLEPETGVLYYINGGHEPLFIINSNGGIRETLKSTGPAVGMLPNLKFKIKQTQLLDGDILFGYTDGVPEARAIDGKFFTAQRLLSILEEPPVSANQLIQTISNQVLKFTGEAEQHDDITILSIQKLNNN